MERGSVFALADLDAAVACAAGVYLAETDAATDGASQA